jgi:hypothetical protein
VHLFVYKW